MHTLLVECTKGRMQSIVDVSMIAYKKLTNNKDSMHYYLPPEREKSDHCYCANRHFTQTWHLNHHHLLPTMVHLC